MIIECTLVLPDAYDGNASYNGLKFNDHKAVVRDDMPHMKNLLKYYKKAYACTVIGEEQLGIVPEEVIDGPAPVHEDKRDPDVADILVPVEEDESSADEDSDDEFSDDDSDDRNYTD